MTLSTYQMNELDPTQRILESSGNPHAIILARHYGNIIEAMHNHQPFPADTPHPHRTYQFRETNSDKDTMHVTYNAQHLRRGNGTAQFVSRLDIVVAPVMFALEMPKYRLIDRHPRAYIDSSLSFTATREPDQNETKFKLLWEFRKTNGNEYSYEEEDSPTHLKVAELIVHLAGSRDDHQASFRKLMTIMSKKKNKSTIRTNTTQTESREPLAQGPFGSEIHRSLTLPFLSALVVNEEIVKIAY